ncbi:MAG: DUF3147 family protein [Thiohalorhabdaceae bacterium]
MAYYLTKTLITVVLVVAISEVAKRSSLIGGILASVPITSVLAMVWLYVDTGDVGKISSLAISVLSQEFVAFLSCLRRFRTRRADEGVVNPRRGGATQCWAGAGAPLGRARMADGAASAALDGQPARRRPASLRRPPSWPAER